MAAGQGCDVEQALKSLTNAEQRKSVQEFINQLSGADSLGTTIRKTATQAVDAQKERDVWRKRFAASIVFGMCGIAVFFGLFIGAIEMSKESHVVGNNMVSPDGKAVRTGSSDMAVATDGILTMRGEEQGGKASIKMTEATTQFGLFELPYLSAETLSTAIGRAVRYSDIAQGTLEYATVSSVSKPSSNVSEATLYLSNEKVLQIKPEKAVLIVNGAALPLCGDVTCAHTYIESAALPHLGEAQHRRSRDCEYCGTDMIERTTDAVCKKFEENGLSCDDLVTVELPEGSCGDKSVVSVVRRTLVDHLISNLDAIPQDINCVWDLLTDATMTGELEAALLGATGCSYSLQASGEGRQLMNSKMVMFWMSFFATASLTGWGVWKVTDSGGERDTSHK